MVVRGNYEPLESKVGWLFFAPLPFEVGLYRDGIRGVDISPIFPFPFSCLRSCYAWVLPLSWASVLVSLFSSPSRLSTLLGHPHFRDEITAKWESHITYLVDNIILLLSEPSSFDDLSLHTVSGLTTSLN